LSSAKPSPWLWILGLAAAAGMVYLLRSLMLPILLAAGIAYFLNPIVMKVQDRGYRRDLATIALFVAFLVIVGLAGWLLWPRLKAEGHRIGANLPALTQRLEATLDAARRDALAAAPALSRALPPAGEPGWLEHWLEKQSGQASALLGQAGSFLFILILAPIFAFFFLRDGGRMLDGAVEKLSARHVETSVAVWCSIDQIIGRYIRGLMMESLCVGALATIGLWLLGVPYPLVLGVFAGAVNPLPYLGAILSLVASLLVAMATQQGAATLGLIVALFLVIRLLDDFVIIPLTIGGSMHLHPALVILSILAGEHALGVIGMVLAVPTVTVLKETGKLLLEHRRMLARRDDARLPVAVATTHFVC
jgi:predicted PurR-regulated permease PerM